MVRRERHSEIVFADERPPSTLAGAVRRRDLARLGRGVYTPNVRDEPAAVVRRNWSLVVAHRFPGAVVTDRSAVRGGPAADGTLFVAAASAGELSLPGLAVHARRGPGAMPGDIALPDGVHLAGRPRALLENVARSRPSRDRPARTLTMAELGDWIDRLLSQDGPSRLSGWRAELATVAAQLDIPEEHLSVVDGLIGVALGTRTMARGSPALAARSRGLPYDHRRIALFERFAEALRDLPLAEVVAPPAGAAPALPFFEAYFSNFIEGTQFSLDEAEKIVREGRTPHHRPADAHDVRGTYAVVADADGMAAAPTTLDEHLGQLQRWHEAVMGGRPEKRPGQWKIEPNRVGLVEFVQPDLAVGTLARAWDLRQTLLTPSKRAVFALFSIAEVHPFADGNGRVARIAMNAELVAGRESRVIVPIVSRNDYLNGLRRLTQYGQPDLLVDVFNRLQRFTAAVDFSSDAAARAQLTDVNAFVDANDAESRGIHLRMPWA